jgi:hypothetical protein
MSPHRRELYEPTVPNDGLVRQSGPVKFARMGEPWARDEAKTTNWPKMARF